MVDVRELAIKWALKNAVDHGGRAELGPVIAKMVAESPEVKARIKELRPVIQEAVEQVNAMSLEEQVRRLEEIAPELLRREARKEEKKLPPLPNAVKGKVVTRLPPEPSGYMHLGHAMSGLLNYLYARMYEGGLWLRFEDTNPRKAGLEYYENFRRGYRWLGIEWDYEKNNSDDMKLYYEYAEKLIKEGHLYVCTCTPEEMSRQRREMRECLHRRHTTDENMELWSRMQDGGFKEGEAVVRLAGDMRSKNTAMRDPVMFRIVEHPHPIVGDRYRVWPTYDFAASIQDSLCGVTHVLRSSEFAFRDELQNYIRRLLGMRNPTIIEYSRFEFKGTPTSKRVIRELIEEGVVEGWDDPRLTTIDAIRRRGILPEAIKEFTITQTGFSYAKRVYDWSLIASINRKILDPVARRMFFVPEPVKLTVEGLGYSEVTLPYHPSRDMGVRVLKVDNWVYVPRNDLTKIGVGNMLRLKQLANVKLTTLEDDTAVGEFMGKEPVEGVPIIQWVGLESADVVVYKPGELIADDGSVNRDSMGILRGVAERSVETVRYDEVVQFERFGFCRRDSGEELKFIYAHD
ncbi:MAG TPA: glutamate--tRNA ligase [Candidatus Caldiarchaeum subterraneum]|uniref:Glutamate--tRNA ligase n=1 Tax=Caldiarchaeum subterraneum TaxID=311458 RepID=A0A833E9C1_CALS0|nr:glutamate--tRNA ligase [Candidatus Caldarchaeum subterraneum]